MYRGGERKCNLFYLSTNPYFSRRTRLIFNEPDVISSLERIVLQLHLNYTYFYKILFNTKVNPTKPMLVKIYLL